ncbi:MAG: hypothetical protein MZW92_77820 [Comamonadaceae bacterium]|nr:hypothetical protein [Comamonadaceae bacterium]
MQALLGAGALRPDDRARAGTAASRRRRHARWLPARPGIVAGPPAQPRRGTHDEALLLSRRLLAFPAHRRCARPACRSRRSRSTSRRKTMADGGDYRTINPKGYVPLLELDDGQRLSEGPAIVQYVADRVPAKKLAPGQRARWRATALHGVAELHHHRAAQAASRRCSTRPIRKTC